ncbi:MAG: YbjQ family protein [Bacteroidetes bacterium]|nr:YbjQ family protein [Bacteroidota bacterium]
MVTSFIPVTSADHIPGETIKEHIDVVCGNTVRAKHVGRDIMAGLKTLVGGEIRGYTEMLSEARDEALDRMKEDAIDLGADAVINVRFTTSMVMQGMAEMLAYGTAVRLE